MKNVQSKRFYNLKVKTNNRIPYAKRYYRIENFISIKLFVVEMWIQMDPTTSTAIFFFLIVFS